MFYIFFFFFQAEDGIRDGHVTGVQTCALPIFFYVKDYGTMRRQSERAKRFGPETAGQKIVVEFKDGEKLWGVTEQYSTVSRGFFFIPADPQENNTRIFIVNSSVKQIHF